MLIMPMRPLVSRATAFIAVVFLIFFSKVHAQTLGDVRFSELPGDRFEVRMQFDALPQDPVGYTIEQPARIVLDFAGVENQLTGKKFPLSFENAKSAVVLSSGDRTRLILNLSQLTSYSTRTDGDSFIIEVGSKQEKSYLAGVSSATNKLAAEINEHQSSVSGIDFRRGETGEGKVIVDLSDPSVDINVEQKGAKIAIEFIGAQLPTALRRSLDVTDFATPVTMVDADYDGKKTTLEISAVGEYDYLAYQADNTYVISVKPLTEAEVEEKNARFSFVGEKLSLNFQSIEVRSVLQLIADFTELNLVASDTVGGSITLRLDNVPWDQALDLVLKTKGLDKRQIGNVLMVAPAAEIANRERQELETRRQLAELAPLRTEHIRVLYADATALFNLFDDGSGEESTSSILSERGSVIVDERTNSIILTETEEKIEEFKRLVSQIDIPIRQVLIEARLVTASTDIVRDLGVEWTAGYIDNGDDSSAFVGGNLNDDIALNNGVLTGDFGSVDLGAVSATSDIAFGYVTDNFLVELELSALESEGYGEIISQPKVVTGDQQTAVIRSGSEIPFQQASASGATTTAYRDATLSLEVTPQITPDDHIILNLTVNQDAIGEVVAFGANSAPTIDVTEVDTQVLVKNGETIVLGGIFQSNETYAEVKVPFISDIPVVGNLFKRTTRDTDKTELLIFITPRLLEDPVRRQ